MPAAGARNSDFGLLVANQQAVRSHFTLATENLVSRKLNAAAPIGCLT